jgi:ribonucleoside-diphosphate reductase alpha chain
MSKFVIHRDGRQEQFTTEKIIDAIKYILEWAQIGDPFVAMFKIIKNFELKLPDQVTTSEIDQLLLKSIESLISEDPDYDIIATKQLIKITNKMVDKQVSSFSEYIKRGVELDMLDARLLDFDLWMLELNINTDYDNNFNYFGLSTLRNKYLIRDYDQNLIEKPQWLHMRVAMGLSLIESDKENFTLQLYKKFASLKYTHATPTLFHSGTKVPQLSSCFINVVDDNMENIMDKAKECALLAKYAGGIGMSITKLRATGSHIKGINGQSSGPIPFIKIYDSLVGGIMQGGKRRANIAMYMEPRHYNFHDFLDLKETNGHEHLRARNINTAVWVPDEFMKRVLSDDSRYMFDPNECKELTESWGEEWEAHYRRYIELAEAGSMKLFAKVQAQDLYRTILTQMAKTGNYWINFKDTANRASQSPNYALIHSSNLCTEIFIPNRSDSTATCTLASINLWRFTQIKHSDNARVMSYEEKLTLIDQEDLITTVRLAIRALDNVVDINYYPSQDAKRNSMDLRPLGLWVSWFGDLLIQLNIAYDSPDCVRISTYLSKLMYDAALETSEWLAVERGAFADYQANPHHYSYKARRNSLLLALMPTATTSNILGTSSCIEPYFSNVYTREIISGKFTVVNNHLVSQLKKANMWNEDIKWQIIANGGSVQNIEDLKDVIDRPVFKTVYESSPLAQVDVGAAWQKHVDQGISRNIYGAPNWRDKLFDVYMYAWQQWLKGTYYCFIEKDIQGEKYTQTVNKRGVRAWFWATIQMDTDAANAVAKDKEEEQEKTARWFWAPVARWFWSAAPALEVEWEVMVQWLTKSQIEAKLIAEKWQEYVDKLKKGELYDWCPTNPFEAVMCEACQ